MSSVSVCLSVCLSVSVSVSVYLFVFLFICVSMCMYVCVCVCVYFSALGVLNMIQYTWVVKRGIKRTPNVFAYAYPNKCSLSYSFSYRNHANISSLIFMSLFISHHLIFILLAILTPPIFLSCSVSLIYPPFTLSTFISASIYFTLPLSIDGRTLGSVSYAFLLLTSSF